MTFDSLTHHHSKLDPDLPVEELRRRLAEAEAEILALRADGRSTGWHSRHQQLMDLSARVVAEKSLPGLLQTIVEAAVQLTGARLGVSGHGYVEGKFQVGAVSRRAADEVCPPGEIFQVEQGGVYLDLIHKTPTLRLAQAELAQHPAWWGLPPEHAPLNGLLGARLIGREGQPNGVIMVSDKEQGEFTEEDEALIAQLANIASLSLQHIEARLETERQRVLLEAVLGGDPAGLAVVAGPELVFRVANPAYRAIIPDPKIDPIGRPYGEIWKVEHGFRTEGLIRRVLKTGESISSERHQRRYPSGIVRFFSMHITPLPGEPPAAMIALWETTRLEEAQRQAMAATAAAQLAADEAEQARNLAVLRAEEAEEGRRVLEALMAYIPEGVTVADAPDVKIRLVSRFGQEMTGQPEGHLENLTLEAHPDRWQIYGLEGQALVPAEELPLSRAVLRGEVVQNEALLLKNAAGQMVPILCNAGPIRNEAGEITGGIIAWRDITQILEMEQALKRHAQQAEAEAELSKQLAEAGADEQSVLELVARRVAELFGDTCSACLASDDGTRFSMVAIHNSDPTIHELVQQTILSVPMPALEEFLLPKIMKGLPVFQPVFDTNLLPKDLVGYKPHSLIAAPIKASGHTIGLLALTRIRPTGPYTEEDLVLLQDLADRTGLAVQNARLLRELQTELALRERAEIRLANYSRQLELTNKELQEFSFVASHDLQEPLRKIIAFGKRLEESYADQLGPEGSDFIARMQNAGVRMQEMLNALLLYSRISTRARPMAPVDLVKVVQEVLIDLELLLEDSGGTVELGSLPVIEADELQMRQLFQNLLTNALKFHPPGVVPRVRVEVIEPVQAGASAYPGGSQFVDIVVADNGIGFDMKNVDRIFQPFQRLHGRTEYPGSGMGLAICKKIVERHGGSLTAESQPGQGSRFLVRLLAKQG